MNIGSHHSEETKQKMSEAKFGTEGWNKGIPWSEEVKQKMSAARMGIPAWNKGVSPSEEARAKMRAAHLGKKLSPEHRAKLAASLRVFSETRRGIPLVGEALERAKESIKICTEKSKITRAKFEHCLSEINAENLTACCSLCGLVPISRNSRQRTEFQCRLASKKIKVAYSGQALTLWEAQNGNCAVCFQPMKLSGISSTSVHADHDHETKLLRGFLHSNCNRGIGYFNDDPVKLRQAAEYLERAGASNAKVQTS